MSNDIHLQTLYWDKHSEKLFFFFLIFFFWHFPCHEQIQHKTNWYFFLFFYENRIGHFVQIISYGDKNCTDCQILFSRKNISKCYLLKLLPSMQSSKLKISTLVVKDILSSGMAFGINGKLFIHLCGVDSSTQLTWVCSVCQLPFCRGGGSRLNGLIKQEFRGRRHRTCWRKSHRSLNQNVVIK